MGEAVGDWGAPVGSAVLGLLDGAAVFVESEIAGVVPLWVGLRVGAMVGTFDDGDTTGTRVMGTMGPPRSLS